MTDIKNIIVDCDAGTDDALALIIFLTAHKYKKINLKAITCVNGNTTVDHVVKNVFRILNICEVADIPVYRGAHSSLMNPENVQEGLVECYHGYDGFGDVYHDDPDISKLQTEHAAYGMNKIATSDFGNISLVCLGPLTNVALAMKLNPEFMSNLKEIYIMGGNTSAIGNVTPQAEFNVYVDPESAFLVFNSSAKYIYLLPWETCLNSRITHEWRNNVLGKINTPCVQMMNKIEEGCKHIRVKKQFKYYITCDAILAGIVMRQDIAKTVVLWHADVELNGKRTRGQVVLDHLKWNKPNVHLIEDLNPEIFKELLLFAVNPTAFDKSILSM